jgi:hypothetical protein
MDKIFIAEDADAAAEEGNTVCSFSSAKSEPSVDEFPFNESASSSAD